MSKSRFKRLRKLTGGGLALLMALSPTMGHAADLTNSSGSNYTDGVEGYVDVGEDTTQSKVSSKVSVDDVSDTTYADTSEAEVYATRNSIFSVIIPKVITLDGSTKAGDYQVAVKGDLSGSQEISVTPDENVTLHEQNAGVNPKADVVAGIVQGKTVWNQSEILADVYDGTGTTKGTITADGITAGSWMGNFNFDITLTSQQTGPSLPEAGQALSTYSWSEIQAISESGRASEYFNVGDTKDIDINGTAYTVAIADFNHDDLADGTGKAGITFSMVDCLNDYYKMNSTNTNVGGWGASEMRSYLSTDVYNSLSDELKSAIKTVTKTTNEGNSSSGVTTTDDKLFLFSVDEVYGVSQSADGQTGVGNGYMVYGYSNSASEDTQYPYFQTAGNVIKKINDSASWWWLRSPHAGDSKGFRGVGSSGGCNYSFADGTAGVAFGFSI